MPSETQRFYQGRDWTTVRLSVAEAFDTLDRLYDLCVYEDFPGEEEDDEEPFAFQMALHGLTESLAAQLAFAEADTIPPTNPTGGPEQSWAVFEIDRALADLKEKLRRSTADQTASQANSIVLLVSRMKTGLKKLDQ